MNDANELVVSWKNPTVPVTEMPMFGWALHSSDDTEEETDLDVLFEYAEHFDDTKFVGAIFHVSRCGSTALSNAFKCVPGTLVLSEPNLFSQLIRETEWGGARVPDDQREILVKGFLGAVTKEYPASAVVVKCSPISTITLDQSLKYMPKAPWCFISRNPADVMKSLEQTPGMWLRTQGIRERLLRQIGRTSESTTPAERSRDLYAFLLERFYRAAMKYEHACSRFFDYADFNIDSVCDVIATILKQPLDEASRDAIAMSMQLYSKSPSPRPFLPTDPGADSTGYAELDQAYRQYLVSCISRTAWC